jgi:energy-coupling factor transporter ATP-binding protein EcfA2
MKFVKFKIKNFKGIEDVVFDLRKAPDANIYTLVGLNESGKTTILEAINLFNSEEQDMSLLELPGSKVEDLTSLIPMSERVNFHGKIVIEVTLELSENELDKINEIALTETQYKKVKPKNPDGSLTYFRNYIFENSKFVNTDHRWSSFEGVLKNSKKEKFVSISGEENTQDNAILSKICRKMIPSILYFPNFLFDFPAKIALESKSKLTSKESFFIDLIQDILSSLDNDTNIKTHLVDRIKSNDNNDSRNLGMLLQKMSREVTNVVFEGWNKIFKREFKETRVLIKSGVENLNAYIEFEIEAPDGIFLISERSLGFRWFFMFLLFTQFRPHRKESPDNILFLFDEPASNLHSSAQKQLLESFENLTKSSKIIYTTHSHHLINAKWLESTYVVKNEGLEIENQEKYVPKNTKILIRPYREFAALHPNNTAYFQPILDVLDYVPSDLEHVPDCIFLEGKNDFYTLSYFSQIIFNQIGENKIPMMPSTGSGNIDALISLYIGWGRNFIVLLDSDKEGRKQKKRYFDSFGKIVEDRIYELSDIDSAWVNIELEDLIEDTEKSNIQHLCYPDQSKKYSKKLFNRAIQEKLMTKEGFEFSEATKNNFMRINAFLKEKLILVSDAR